MELPHSSLQERPTFAQVRAACQQVSLEFISLPDPRLDAVLNRLREARLNGGALFASFRVGANEAFDWFALRGRLLEFGVLRQLFDRAEVNAALPELHVEPSRPDDPAFVVYRLGDHGPVDPGLAVYGVGEDFEVGQSEFDGDFRATSSFLLDGELAQKLYYGGAYSSAKRESDGRAEKESALAFCDALFGLRFSEVDYYATHNAWTPWFGGIAWDWTAVLFDRRSRALSILAVTDTD